MPARRSYYSESWGRTHTGTTDWSVSKCSVAFQPQNSTRHAIFYNAVCDCTGALGGTDGRSQIRIIDNNTSQIYAYLGMGQTTVSDSNCLGGMAFWTSPASAGTQSISMQMRAVTSAGQITIEHAAMLIMELTSADQTFAVETTASVGVPTGTWTNQVSAAVVPVSASDYLIAFSAELRPNSGSGGPRVQNYLYDVSGTNPSFYTTYDYQGAATPAGEYFSWFSTFRRPNMNVATHTFSIQTGLSWGTADVFSRFHRIAAIHLPAFLQYDWGDRVTEVSAESATWTATSAAVTVSAVNGARYFVLGVAHTETDDNTRATGMHSRVTLDGVAECSVGVHLFSGNQAPFIYMRAFQGDGSSHTWQYEYSRQDGTGSGHADDIVFTVLRLNEGSASGGNTGIYSTFFSRRA